MSVLELVRQAKKDISDSYQEIKDLQDTCSHRDVVKKYGSSTGGYDPNDDYYWTDFNCPDCLKMWRMEGSL